MRKKKTLLKKTTILGLMTISCSIGLWNPSQIEIVEAAKSVATHIGTFEGSTTFRTSSRNGINPGLFIEVMDEYGNLTQYESEEGVITIPNTKEGAYVTQAKLLGKTKYRDQETGELLDDWEEGRNLSLESVENPILTTTGKNLIDNSQFIQNKAIAWASGEIVTWENGSQTHENYIPINYQSTYVVSGQNNLAICFYDANKQPIGFLKPNSQSEITEIGVSGSIWVKSFNMSNYPEVKYMRVTVRYDSDGGFRDTSTLQIEESSIATSYEPYQSNTLAVNDAIVLRGLPNGTCDTIDLNTGEYVQRMDEIFLNGDETWQTTDTEYGEGLKYFYYNHNRIKESNDIEGHLACDKLKHIGYFSGGNNTESIRVHGKHSRLQVFIQKSKLSIVTVDGFKEWLSQNPMTVQHELKTPIVEPVALSSDYFFKPVNNESIEVVGTIEPLIVSITVPTDSLSFTLDPNQEDGQQFIAPNFTLTNETLAPLQVELKTFEQTTDVLNDVLPNAHDSWSELNKTQSKDIALALVPTLSDGWLSLREGPRYVADTSNDFIGTVKGKSSVDFAFDALHGQAFSEVLKPQYRLTFVFGFSQ